MLSLITSISLLLVDPLYVGMTNLRSGSGQVQFGTWAVPGYIPACPYNSIGSGHEPGGQTQTRRVSGPWFYLFLNIFLSNGVGMGRVLPTPTPNPKCVINPEPTPIPDGDIIRGTVPAPNGERIPQIQTPILFFKQRISHGFWFFCT